MGNFQHLQIIAMVDFIFRRICSLLRMGVCCNASYNVFSLFLLLDILGSVVNLNPEVLLLLYYFRVHVLRSNS